MSPPAFPLLSPCYAFAIRTPVQALRMADESGRQVGGKLNKLQELHRYEKPQDAAARNSGTNGTL